MQDTYAITANNKDGFWRNVFEKAIAAIEDAAANAGLCDPISLKFMRIPVRVKTSTDDANYEHTFDLISLLQCLSTKGENPINRIPIIDLRAI